MTTRTLTFKSTNLGDNVNLLLCFTSPSPDLFVKQFPIAWRVTTLAAQGRSSLTATYVNTLGFCTTQVGAGQTVTAGNYIPIDVGQQTTLTVDSSVRPPVSYFLDPTSLGGPYVKAINNTGGPANIGLGFVTDLNQPTEVMNTALLFKNVGDGLSVTGDFTPKLRAYIALDYQETQLLRADIQSVNPIWEADLVSLQPSTVIIVARSSSGGYTATQLGTSFTDDDLMITSSPSMHSFDEGKMRIYGAELAFPMPNLVVQGMKAIAEQIISRGYQLKFTYKEGSSEASVELTLPYGASCDQAETELLTAMDAQLHSNEKANIKGHTGSLMVSEGEDFTYWSEINPASAEWFMTRKGPTNGGRYHPPPRIGYLAPTASNATQNRPLSKKLSALSLRG